LLIIQVEGCSQCLSLLLCLFLILLLLTLCPHTESQAICNPDVNTAYCGIDQYFTTKIANALDGSSDSTAASIYNDVDFSIIYHTPDGIYSYIFDKNGTCLAHGADPSFVGLNVGDVLAALGQTVPGATQLLDNIVTNGGGFVLFPWVYTSGPLNGTNGFKNDFISGWITLASGLHVYAGTTFDLATCQACVAEFPSTTPCPPAPTPSCSPIPTPAPCPTACCDDDDGNGDTTINFIFADMLPSSKKK